MEKLVCGLLRSLKLFVIFVITKIVTFSLLCFVSIPLSVEEVVIWACGYPSCEEVIVVIVWISALSLLYEVIVVLALCLASCVKVVVLERGVVYFKFVFTKFSVEVPCVGGPMWTYSENPSV